jgi:spore coat protein CotH
MARFAGTVVLLIWIGPSVQGAISAPVSNESTELFGFTGLFPVLKIEIDSTNQAALQKEIRTYVHASVRDAFGEYSNVGIHLKGGAGSFRKLDDRPSLTLNFDRFKKGQRFHGLDKIYLNNSVQDPTLMTEAICGELFRQAGVPAGRATQAHVFLNGRDLGLYVLKEGFNRRFLQPYFGNTKGRLYEGGFIQEITGATEERSSRGTGTNRADLAELAAAALESDLAVRMSRLRKSLEVERMLSFIAMEVMVWHWDGYTLNRNNYRLYHEPDSDKIIFIPNGMDQMFWDSEGPIEPRMQGLIARSLLQIPEMKQRYRDRFSELFTNVFRVAALTNQINQLQGRIRPVLASIDPKLVDDHSKQVDLLRERVVRRAEGIARQLR